MYGARYHDLVEANRQRAHEQQMERRSQRTKRFLIGATAVVAVALLNRSRKTETIEIHENYE